MQNQALRADILMLLTAIIWGSAFNPALNGKIRVSVVATGLEPVSAGAQPVQRAAPFAFQSRPAAAPAAAPAPMSAPSALGTPAPSLSVPAGVTGFGGAPVVADAPTPGFAALDEDTSDALDLTAADHADDELVLDAHTVGTPAGLPAFASPEEGQPAISHGSDFAEGAAEAPAAPRPAAGATLFERMKHLSRMDSGKGAEEDPAAADGGDDEGGFPAIPRFLGRQTNQ